MSFEKRREDLKDRAVRGRIEAWLAEPDEEGELEGLFMAVTGSERRDRLWDEFEALLEEKAMAETLPIRRGMALASQAHLSLTATKPWEREGLSRATWYRRRKTGPGAEEIQGRGMMLTANWGRHGPSLVMGTIPEAEPTTDDLGLSIRVGNALKCNYHGWYDGRCPDYSDPWRLPPAPLSWLRVVMAKPRMWRNLYYVGMKGYAEIQEALAEFDRGRKGEV